MNWTHLRGQWKKIASSENKIFEQGISPNVDFEILSCLLQSQIIAVCLPLDNSLRSLWNLHSYTLICEGTLSALGGGAYLAGRATARPLFAANGQAM